MRRNVLMKKSIRVSMTFVACLMVFNGLTGCGAKEEPATAPAPTTPSANGSQPVAAPIGNQPGNKPLQATQ